MDAAVPGVALGIAVGRIGDLIIADHLGATTALPFGFQCPDVADVGRTVGSPCPPGEIVHLTAAYDLISATITLIVLLAYRRRPRNEGELTLLAAITYGIGRFGFDFLREDVRRLGLTGSQWVAVAVVTTAVAAFVHRRRRTRRDGQPPSPTPTGFDGSLEESVERPVRRMQ
jgi:prolipoprotein diacylglyceryltransferase